MVEGFPAELKEGGRRGNRQRSSVVCGGRGILRSQKERKVTIGVSKEVGLHTRE